MSGVVHGKFHILLEPLSIKVPGRLSHGVEKTRTLLPKSLGSLLSTPGIFRARAADGLMEVQSLGKDFVSVGILIQLTFPVALALLEHV